MRVVLTSAAETDLAAALDWYDAEALGIGPQFLDEFEILLGRLADNPYQFAIIHNHVRRAGFRHFPYGLFYRLRGDTVEVIACLHASRDPRQWRRRN